MQLQHNIFELAYAIFSFHAYIAVDFHSLAEFIECRTGVDSKRVKKTSRILCTHEKQHQNLNLFPTRMKWMILHEKVTHQLQMTLICCLARLLPCHAFTHNLFHSYSFTSWNCRDCWAFASAFENCNTTRYEVCHLSFQ